MPKLLIVSCKLPVNPPLSAVKPLAPVLRSPAVRAMRRAIASWVYEGGAGGDVK